MTFAVRRIVTGHDETGKSIIVSEGTPPNVLTKGTGVDFIELWHTRGAPTHIKAIEAEPTNGPLITAPPEMGTRFRINVLEPFHFHKLPPSTDGRAPGMHRTRSVDYGIVLSGEVYLVLDDSERLLKPGDVVIQRGTDHAWENRSNAPAVIAFILIDGQFDTGLHEALVKNERMASYNAKLAVHQAVQKQS
ncbi:MAG: cupin domain-containing protein [Steroidobacteraceae bacterium]